MAAPVGADTATDAVASDPFAAVLMGTPIASLIIEAAADDDDALSNDQIIAAVSRIDWARLVRNIGPEMLRRNNPTVQDLQQQVVLLSAENATMRANIAAAADAAAAALLTPSQEQQPWSESPTAEDDSKVFDENTEPSEATKMRVLWNERSVKSALKVSSHNAKLNKIILNIDGTPVDPEVLHGIRADGKVIVCCDLADLVGKTLRNLNKTPALRARVMAAAKKLASKWKVLRMCCGMWKAKIVIAHALRNAKDDLDRQKTADTEAPPSPAAHPPAGPGAEPAPTTPSTTAESPTKAVLDRRAAVHASAAARAALRTNLNALQAAASSPVGSQLAPTSAEAGLVTSDDTDTSSATPLTGNRQASQPQPTQGHPEAGECRTGTISGEGEAEIVELVTREQEQNNPSDSEPSASGEPSGNTMDVDPQEEMATEADATPRAAPTRDPTVDLDKIEAATLRVILTNRAIAFEKGAKGKRLRHALDAAAKDDPVTAEEVAKAAIEVKAAALQARVTRKKNKAASGEQPNIEP
ncbi:hypothetical protein OC842_007420 [Tilletia horrida]|uniref:Uncharacterized protein n=1 Tax=Tilletia horrida TaxID=155126 RepID=A0AAN6G6Q4_9BASI|nr:hypothetical protein OC842_007420 [Tilletia horrida]